MAPVGTNKYKAFYAHYLYAKKTIERFIFFNCALNVDYLQIHHQTSLLTYRSSLWHKDLPPTFNPETYVIHDSFCSHD